MAKRFTDTEKWKKPWFRSLKPKYKCFWQYIIDNCNHAGVWEVDFELASYLIGGNKLDEKEVKEVFKKQYVEIDNGKRWFIRDFIEFQYGCLNEKNNAHKSVIKIIKKLGAIEGLVCPYPGDKDMDKDKDKEKEEFENFWKIYPNKKGKAIAQKKFEKLKDSEIKEIMIALPRHIQSDQWQKDDGQFIPHPATWLNQRRWEDEISEKKVVKRETIKL